jgi:hypothetical protein
MRRVRLATSWSRRHADTERLVDGVTVTVKAAHVRLCYSRIPFVRAYPRETRETVFDAHDRAFALFKGACGRGIYDNMKTAVETIFAGKQRLYKSNSLVREISICQLRSRRENAVTRVVWSRKDWNLIYTAAGTCSSSAARTFAIVGSSKP